MKLFTTASLKMHALVVWLIENGKMDMQCIYCRQARTQQVSLKKYFQKVFLIFQDTALKYSQTTRQRCAFEKYLKV